MSEGTTVAKGAQPKKIKGGPFGRLALFFRQVID